MSNWLKGEQNRLRKSVIRKDDNILNRNHVTGVDVAYQESLAFGAAVTLDIADNTPLRETRTVVTEVGEYVPGQFYLREGPVLEQLLLKDRPRGPVLVDGNGILHPRRFGLASHIGVRLDLVTIGVGKSLLLGEIGESDDDRAEIVHRGEVVGMALWLGEGENPIYVSVGHRVSLQTCVSIVRACSQRGFPEPLRLADRSSKEQKRRFLTNRKGASSRD